MRLRAGVGSLIGPGLVNLNAGLSKSFSITERVKFKLEGSFANALNHRNLATPIIAIDDPNVGQITSAQPADFLGAWQGQVGARLDF